MRKIICFAALIFLLPSICFAGWWGSWNEQSTQGPLTVYGNLTFQTNIAAAGVSTGGVSADVPTTATTLAASCSAAYVSITTRTLTIANGKVGQIITLFAKPLTDTGSLTVTATTKYGWSTITMDAVLDFVTLLYLDDTYGWVIIGYNSVTVD